jgi:hypothetical protein
VSQEFVLDDLTEHEFTEDELRQEVEDNGWYTEAINSYNKLLEIGANYELVKKEKRRVETS